MVISQGLGTSIRERAQRPGERGQSGEDETESRGVTGERRRGKKHKKLRWLFKVVKKAAHRLRRKCALVSKIAQLQSTAKHNRHLESILSRGRDA